MRARSAVFFNFFFCCLGENSTFQTRARRPLKTAPAWVISQQCGYGCLHKINVNNQLRWCATNCTYCPAACQITFPSRLPNRFPTRTYTCDGSQRDTIYSAIYAKGIFINKYIYIPLDTVANKATDRIERFMSVHNAR